MKSTGTQRRGRPPSGHAKWHGDKWLARITLDDGKRKWIALDPRLGVGDEEKAKSLALALQLRVREIKGTTTPQETVREYAERWLAWRETSGLRSVHTDRGRLDTHVLPAIGHLACTDVCAAHLRKLVTTLDARVRNNEISWRTARNAWANVTKMFSDMVEAKPDELRVRSDNPASGVRPPDRGVVKTKQYFYPSEVTKILTCAAIPLRWRRLIALSTYSYLRASELRALCAGDIDLEHGTIHVHRSVEQFAPGKRGNIKKTKTLMTRKVPVEPELMPLLRWMLDGLTDEDRLVAMPPPEDLPKKLRMYAKRAGVTRSELFTNDDTRKHMTWHDLRATGITWLAVRGEGEIKIMRRAGHTRAETTQGYIREAELLGETFGDTFPPLPRELYEDPVQGDSSILGKSLGFRHELKRSDLVFPRDFASPAGFEPALAA